MESHTVAEEGESIPRCSERMLSAAFPSVLYWGAWRDPKTDRAINVRVESIDKLAQFAEAVAMTKFFCKEEEITSANTYKCKLRSMDYVLTVVAAEF